MVMLLVRVMPTAVADIDHAKQLRGRGEVLIVACGYSMTLYAAGFGPRALARPRCTRVPGTAPARPPGPNGVCEIQDCYALIHGPRLPRRSCRPLRSAIVMVDEQLNGEQVDDQRRETMTATAMQVLSPGASLTAREVPLRSPSAGHVRLEVAAAGMCGNDIGTAAAGGTDGAPATPGHEIAGTIAQIGAGVKGFDPGDRVAVGWFGGSCGQCRR